MNEKTSNNIPVVRFMLLLVLSVWLVILSILILSVVMLNQIS